MLGSSFTAGFGGSIGLESPIIAAGASLRVRAWTKVTPELQNIIHIGCGVPQELRALLTHHAYAAVVFGLEVLMLDLATASIILTDRFCNGRHHGKLPFPTRYDPFQITQPFEIYDPHFYVILGVQWFGFALLQRHASCHSQAIQQVLETDIKDS